MSHGDFEILPIETSYGHLNPGMGICMLYMHKYTYIYIHMYVSTYSMSSIIPSILNLDNGDLGIEEIHEAFSAI